ncbi:hypothetical protein PJL15_00069 [Paenarthrobacter nitroguajacolicus]|nr:hypothetical protein [Paenarthrobacter nitroguajacolicus]
MDRLFPWFLLKGHFRSLSIRTDTEHRQNWPVTLLVYGAPFVALVIYWALDANLSMPVVIQRSGPVLTAVALLAGGTLTAFTHISTLRLKLTERADSSELPVEGESLDGEASDRAMVDEVATHLLMASLFSTLTALVLILGMNFAAGEPGLDEIRGPMAWIINALLIFDATLYWIAIPRIYLAYVELNKVDPRMAGNASGY